MEMPDISHDGLDFIPRCRAENGISPLPLAIQANAPGILAGRMPVCGMVDHHGYEFEHGNY
jgi:hypothetical protein